MRVNAGDGCHAAVPRAVVLTVPSAPHPWVAGSSLGRRSPRITSATRKLASRDETTSAARSRTPRTTAPGKERGRWGFSGVAPAARERAAPATGRARRAVSGSPRPRLQTPPRRAPRAAAARPSRPPRRPSPGRRPGPTHAASARTADAAPRGRAACRRAARARPSWAHRYPGSRCPRGRRLPPWPYSSVPWTGVGCVRQPACWKRQPSEVEPSVAWRSGMQDGRRPPRRRSGRMPGRPPATPATQKAQTASRPVW
eukprot:scaffold5056_cov94-Isochrysis_galbana.AAC.3